MLTTNEIASDHVGPVLNPPHLDEPVRESMDEVSSRVTETSARLGCERGTLSRLLNSKEVVSAYMALALEDIGWGTADHWMRMQASADLPRARLDRASSERPTDKLHAYLRLRPDCGKGYRVGFRRLR